MAELRLACGIVATVDDVDLDRVSAYRWSTHTSSDGIVYASRWVSEGGRRTRVHLHRWLMDARPGQLVDHRDRDTLNNRRSNLRFASVSENLRNRMFSRQSSGRKGVYPHGRGWTVRICVDGRRINLGTHADLTAAAAVYDLAARKLHGEFAATNFANAELAVAALSGCETARAAAQLINRLEA